MTITRVGGFPKLDHLKAGNKLIADGGFTCLKEGEIVEVAFDGMELYVLCSEGHHYLEGQRGNHNECVGLWLVE